ncbi:MAG: ATP synthase subunit I [Deltaproteobacteria bacterium]|nr:ATP synthase subunit I [Deltaproteobacteria bacterium]
MEKSPLQKRIELGNWLILAFVVLVSSIFLSIGMTLGILFGGLISIVNFYWLARDLKKLFLIYADKAKPYIMLKFFLRFGVTGIALFVIVTQTPVSVIGLVIGLSLVVVNIIITVIGANVKNPLRRFRKKDASSVISR